MNRRQLLGTGAGAAAGATLSGCAAAAPGQVPPAAPSDAERTAVVGVGSIGKGSALAVDQPHRVDVGALPPKRYDGGQLQAADSSTMPILRGQDVSGTLVRLGPGGVREPHWHPAAWEMHYVIQGRARFTVVETRSYQESFEAGAGTAVFLTQGSLHYFENVTPNDGEYVAWLVFNTSTEESDDDIGVVSTLGALPPDVLGACFGVDQGVFANLPKKQGPVTIVRKR